MTRTHELQDPVAYGRWLRASRTTQDWADDERRANDIKLDWENGVEIVINGDHLGPIPYEGRVLNNPPHEDVHWLLQQREELLAVIASHRAEATAAEAEIRRLRALLAAGGI